MLLDAHLIKRIIIDEIAKIDFETNISIKGNLSISIDNNDCYLVDIKEIIYKSVTNKVQDKWNKDLVSADMIKGKHSHLDEANPYSRAYMPASEGNMEVGSPTILDNAITIEKEAAKAVQTSEIVDVKILLAKKLQINKIKKEIKEKQVFKKVLNEKFFCPPPMPNLEFESVFKPSDSRKTSSAMCLICSRLFSIASNTSTHHEMHKTGACFSCTECGFAYATKIELFTHHLCHAENNPKPSYMCNICSKSFKGVNKLKLHNYVHTGERPFVCGVCEHTFKTKDTLNNHMRIHTGEKPYKCKFCKKSYTHWSGYSIHLRTHTGEKPYQCKDCGKKLLTWNGLERHKRVHTGEMPFRCPICTRMFANKYNMRTHITKTHKVDCKTLQPLAGKVLQFVTNKPSITIENNVEIHASIQQQLGANCIQHTPMSIQNVDSIIQLSNNLQPTQIMNVSSEGIIDVCGEGNEGHILLSPQLINCGVPIMTAAPGTGYLDVSSLCVDTLAEVCDFTPALLNCHLTSVPTDSTISPDNIMDEV